MTYEEVRDRIYRIDDKDCGEGVPTAEIQEAEARLGIAFPVDYRRFLQDFGWLQVGPTEIFGLGLDAPSYLDVVQMTLTERRDAQSEIPGMFLPIMNDGGGNLYCLDCENVSAPVVIWDHISGLARLEVGFVDWLADAIG